MRSKINLYLLAWLAFWLPTQLFSQDSHEIILPTNGEIQTDVQVIKNINTVPFEEGFSLQWNLDYRKLLKNKDSEYSISIHYKLSKADDQRWTAVRDLSIEDSHYEIKGLVGGKEYEYQVGVVSAEDEYWSEVYLAVPGKPWGLFNFLVLIGSLGLFIYGMKIMSEGVQIAAGSRLRHLLGSITSNHFKSITTGAGVTALLQSSTVTAVMTVSFVNAGLLTLTQSAGVFLGANVGTTVTGWIISFFGFKVDLSAYALVLIAIASPLLFLGSSKIKAWGSVIIGFSILFMGLGFLQEAVPNFNTDSALVKFFVRWEDVPYLSTLIFIIFGLVITVIVQSSSAALALTMALVAGGVISFEVAAAMVLGENLGTTITAELASTVGNVYAKRAARINTLTNLFGVIWAAIALSFMLEGIDWLMLESGLGSPYEHPKQFANLGLAIFHTGFNIVNVLILMWFIPFLVKAAEFTVKSKGSKDKEFHLDYIGAGIMATPNLSLIEAKKEIAKFGEITSRMSHFARELLFEDNKRNQKKLAERIAKYEEITDKVEVEVANYLNKIVVGANVDIAKRIRGMNDIVNSLERIGDIFYKISLDLEKKIEEKIIFTDVQERRLIEMFDLIDMSFDVMIENLNTHVSEVTLDDAIKMDQKVKDKLNEIKREYLDSLTKVEEANLRGGFIYNNIFAALERISRHIKNVSEGVVGKV